MDGWGVFSCLTSLFSSCSILWLTVTILVLYAAISWYRRRQTLSNLPNRHVFITGCDTGFGHMLAIRLDGMGLPVFAGCLTPKGEEELQEKCSSRLVTVPLDVTNESSIREAARRVRERLGNEKGLWGLVNNAGILENSGMVEWLTKDDYMRTLDVNFFGQVETTRMFLPLVRLEKGRIVNMSSIAGSFATPVYLPYGLSKHAVEVFSDTLRYETQQYGVTVHILKPVGFRTHITDMARVSGCVKAVFSRASREVRELYGEEYCNQILPENSFSQHSCEYSVVIDAYVDALLSAYPKQRYPVGPVANCLWSVVDYIPQWLFTFVFSKMLPPLAGNPRTDRK